MAKAWRPVKDGQYGNACVGENGSELWMTAHDPYGNEWYADTFWGDDYRVCALVDVPDATIRMTPTQREEVFAALRVAIQLAEIADDWNMDEVEIDGVMVRTSAISERMKELITELEVTE